MEKDELLKEIDYIIETTENLPNHAKVMPLDQYDMLRILYLIKVVIKGQSHEKK